MYLRIGLQRKLSTEDTFELWYWGRLESPLNCKEIKLVNPKRNKSWIFIRRTDAEAETPILLTTWCLDSIHYKRPWCWESFKSRGKGDGRGWDGWMASLTQWTWIWVSSWSWWLTGKSVVLQSMGSQSWTQLSDWTDWLTLSNKIKWMFNAI